MDENQSETSLQAECVRYMRNDLRVVYGTFFSIPNEGKRGVINASRMLAQGLLSGIPDLCWLIDGTAVFFELKSKKGTTTPKQKLIHKNLIELGYEVHVIKTFDEFRNIVSLRIQNKP
jgi:hypothetical protein